MTLWRLEVLRAVRTGRALLLVGLYVLFGISGPVALRYLDVILDRLGGDLTVVAPDPTPADGFGQFVSNAGQLGVVAVVVVAAAALATDHRPDLAAFLRTRVRSGTQLVLPRAVVAAGSATLALLAGTAFAWALTDGLIGPLPAGAVVVGTALAALHLAFTVAVVALAGQWTRSVLATVFASLGVLLALPLAGLVPAVGRWLPTELIGAVPALADGATVGDHLPAALVTAAATVASLAWACRAGGRREV